MNLIRYWTTNRAYLSATYNQNWGITDHGLIDGFLRGCPLTVFDVGARNGCISELSALRKYLDYIAFEPDEKEFLQLQGSETGYHAFRIFPYYVGSVDGPITFFINQSPDMNSGRRIDPRSMKNFLADGFGVEKSVESESINLDSFLAKERIDRVDMIKLDTEGTEYEILSSAPKALARASLIEVEVSFDGYYEGQYLFHDISKLLREQGFQLLYLNRVFHNRKIFKGEARGQVIMGNALFGKREDCLSELSDSQKAKYVILLVNYGHLDLAFQILAENPDAAGLIPEVDDYLKRLDSKMPRIKRFAIMTLDKLAAFLLSLRKTNAISYDSDRSWPTR